VEVDRKPEGQQNGDEKTALDLPDELGHEIKGFVR